MDKNPGVSFWDLFWTTTGTNGATSPMLVVMVWGPPILLAVIGVLTIIDLALHGDRVRKVYAEFAADGWFAVQLRTGLMVKVGNAQQEMVVLTGPGFPPEQLAPAVAALAQRVNSMDRKQRKAWDAAVMPGLTAGFAPDQLAPELPPGVLACSRRGKGDLVAVINARRGGALRILATKPNAAPVGA